MSFPYETLEVKDIKPVSRAALRRITFEMEPYMRRCREAHPVFFAPAPFYPCVSVFFQILPGQTREHFHVPLTWNPYGYSTYRGS
jgi:5-hydroxyisourate hydrolase/2-oxo-4-hydroxy-4-carboxy-5-ureidoimidazoline decarboxylase